MPEGLLFGRFRVGERIGEGSTGEVFRALDTAFDREIALKILRPEVAQRVGFARFRRQFYLMAQLAHPRVVPAIDMGLDEGRMWFTSELVEGTTLAEIALPLPPERAVHILLEIASGLEFIHAHGILHLDLKPSNVFLASGGAQLMDFGLAGLPGGGPCGTPAYMAPEIASGGHYDARADLYSLGVVALELLTGENPFCKATPAASIRAQIEQPPRVPRLGKRFAPLSSLIGKLLSKDAADRPPTAYSVKIALQDILGIDRTAGEGFFLSEGPFVDRGKELGRIREAWEDIDGPRLFSVVGEVGIGRTSLCERAMLDIRCAGGSTAELRGTRPPIVDILTPFRSKDYSEILATHLPALLSRIGDDLPSSFVEELGIEAGPPPENQAQFDAYAVEFVEALSAKSPLALHVAAGADDPFWEALSKSQSRVLVLFDGEAKWPELRLSDVDREGIEAYIRGIFGPIIEEKGLIDSIVRRAGGNIYNIRKTLRDFVASGALEPTAEAWRFDAAREPNEIPFEERWKALSEPSRLVASAIALAGGLDSGIVEGLSAGDYFFAMYKLLAACLIAERVTPDGIYYYALPELSEKIDDVLTSKRAQEIHRLLAEQFLSAPETVGNRLAAAHHLESAGDGKAAFAIFFEVGTTALKRSDYARAEKAFSSAERLLKYSEKSTITLRALKRLALSRKYMGDFEGARESYYRAAAVADAAEDRSQKASILCDIGVTFFEEGNIPKAIDLYRRAREEHSALGVEKGELIDLIDLAGAYQVAGEPSDARAFYSEAMPIAERLGDNLCRCAISLNLGDLCLSDGDLSGALSQALDAAALARDNGFDHLLFEALLEIATIHRKQGQMRHAARAVAEAEEHRSSADKRGAAVLSVERAAIARTVGDYPAANAALAEAGENLRYLGDSEREKFFAERALLFAISGSEPLPIRRFRGPKEIEEFVEALRSVRSGDLDAARRVFQRSMDEAAFEREDLRTELYIARARLAAADGEWRRAVEILSAAESLLSFRDPFLEGRLFAEKGLILAENGESGPAKVALSAAKSAFAQLENRTELDRLKAVETRLSEPRSGSIGLERLLPIIKALNSTLDSRKLLGNILDAVLDATGAERAILFLVRRGSAELELARAADGSDLPPSSIEFSHGLIERVLESGEPHFSESVSDDESLSSRESVIDMELSMALCVPIRGMDGNIRGLIYADARIGKGRFDDGMLTFLSALGDQAAVALRNAEVFDDLRSERDRMAAELAGGFGGDAIIGKSSAMVALRKKLSVVAPQDISLLITGETGTGKDLVARTIHEESPRRESPFVPINCAAIPENLLESELFGHERGAFTGADRRHIGSFELANHGTLFLDEIGEMPVALQAKLLRAIESRRFTRLGGDEEIDVDLRIIAATNLDPQAALDSGKLREDLYYRIAPVQLHLPPLRDRREDIPALVVRFIEESSARFGRDVRSITRDAISAMMRYRWPGNVRELIGAIEEAVLFAPASVIRIDDLPERITRLSADDIEKTGIPRDYEEFKSLKRDMEEQFEKKVLVELLSRHGGNISKAAKSFGINRSRLQQLVKRYGIVINK